MAGMVGRLSILVDAVPDSQGRNRCSRPLMYLIPGSAAHGQEATYATMLVGEGERVDVGAREWRA